MDKALRGVLRSASGIAGSLVFAVGASKLIALAGGSTGVGIFGQLKNLQQTFLGVGTLNGQAAFIQGMASRHSRERWAFAAATIRSMAIVALLLYSLGLASTPWLAARLLGNSDAGSMLGVVLTLTGAILYVCSTITTFVLSAIGRLELVARIQIYGSAGILLGVLIALRTGVGPAAIGFAVLLGGVLSCLMAAKALGRGRFARLVAASAQRRHGERPLASFRAFSAMASGMAIGGLVGAGTRLILRAAIVRRDGLEAAGLFEAAWTISMTYMGLLLTSLGGYLLPALSAERDSTGRGDLLSEFVSVAVACGVPLICGLMLFRSEAVALLYSASLAPAATMLGVMVAGDFFKLLGWVFAMPMLAAADARSFVLFEISWNAVFLGSIMLLHHFNWPLLTAVGMAFVACYLAYAVATYAYCRRVQRLDIGQRARHSAIGGIVIIAVVAALGSLTTSALPRGALVAFALGYSALALGSAGRQAIVKLVRRAA